MALDRSHGLAGGKAGFCFDPDLLWSLGQLLYFPRFLFCLRETGWRGLLSLDTFSKVYSGQILLKLCSHFPSCLLITVFCWHVHCWKLCGSWRLTLKWDSK